MEAREHIDLTKMAVTAMMVTLVLSAMLALFFFLYKVLSDAATDTQQVITTTSTDKLYDLCDATNSGEYPWVTSVINAITEVDDANLLYVQVIDNTATPSTQLYFTYNDVTITGAPVSQIRQNTSPLDECSKYLMGFTNKRCGVQYLTDNAGIDVDGLRFDCLQITILNN